MPIWNAFGHENVTHRYISKLDNLPCSHLKFMMILFAIFVIGLFSIDYSYAEEELPIIGIELVDGNIIDLDQGTQFFRANIDIVNYDPRDGYYFMKVTKLPENEIIKDTEILPKQIEDDLWTVKILHYIDTTLPDEELLGDYELEIYSEFGISSSGTQISIIKSSIPQITTNSTGEVLEITSEPEEIIETTESNEENIEFVEDDSQIPDWVRNIFIWYAEGTITETDLLSALEYLINQEIIDVS